jgi:hypothetical protein
MPKILSTVGGAVNNMKIPKSKLKQIIREEYTQAQKDRLALADRAKKENMTPAEILLARFGSVEKMPKTVRDTYEKLLKQAKATTDHKKTREDYLAKSKASQLKHQQIMSAFEFLRDKLTAGFNGASQRKDLEAMTNFKNHIAGVSDLMKGKKHDELVNLAKQWGFK